MLQRLKLSTRILLLGVIIVVGFSLVFLWLYPKIKGNMYDAKYLKTRHLVEAAWGVLGYYETQVNSNALSLDDAQQKAKATIKNMRYEQEEYFWINDMEPRMIMHTIKPEMDGTDLSNNADPNGKRLFVEMVEICKRKGAGFVDYYWPRPGEPQPVPKISYVKLHPAWGWIVGSGIYIDNVGKEVAEIFSIIFGVVGFMTAFGLFLSYTMARSIARPIDNIVTTLNEGADQVASASEQMSAQAEQIKVVAAELVAVVGGKRKNGYMRHNGTGRERGKDGITTLTNTQSTLPPPKVAKFGKKEEKPNQVIPMDETEFKDF